MQEKTKLFLAVAVAALIVVIALIVLRNEQQKAQEEQATPQPAITAEIARTQEAQATPQSEMTPEPDDEDLYEGALAGLTEEEIGAMAMAEEGVDPEGEFDESMD